MSPFALVDVASIRDSFQIDSALTSEMPNFGEPALDQEHALAEAMEHHAGLLILIGTTTLAVMASFAVLLILQILFA
ncbi:hypothetical protein [Paraburkholderia sp. J11-2]|uniref:hypothetical protein n=1 Tax=Paraburkholderia sp. J11-2 TaxID=2805431 RepID=UPI002AB75AF2|nr:hypothetical protein [Paraburkholderia sp. J11-2]